MQVVACKCATQLASSKSRDEKKIRRRGGVIKGVSEMVVKTLSVRDIEK
jgi:hypothetical protein